MSQVNLLVGTRKGAFLFQSSEGRRDWQMKGHFVEGLDVNHAVIDPRTRTIFATANDPWFGPQVRFSRDMGASLRKTRG